MAVIEVKNAVLKSGAHYVTSDYNENQKRWINSNSLRFVNSSYASIDIYTSTKKNLHLNK